MSKYFNGFWKSMNGYRNTVNRGGNSYELGL